MTVFTEPERSALTSSSVEIVTLSQQPDGGLRSRSSAKRGSGWGIADARGELLAEGLASRSQAIRLLGEYAEGHDLPLRVVDGRGRPTGDRLG